MHPPRRLVAILAAALFVAGCGSSATQANPGATVAPAFYSVSFVDRYAGMGDSFAIPTSAVEIDYWARGSCSLALALAPQGSAGGTLDLPTVAVGSALTSGTWKVSVTPGTYRLQGRASGCMWSVSFRPA